MSPSAPSVARGQRGQPAATGIGRSSLGTPRRQALLLLGLAGAAFLLYANTLPGSLPLDDRVLVGENPLIRQLLPLSRYFHADWWGDSSLYRDDLYRPVTLLTLGLQHALHGTRPLGYHLGNALLYALCSFPVFFLLRRLAGGESAALWGTLVFIAHPLHTEAVASVVGRAEILSFLLGASVLLLHARGYRLPHVGRAGGLALALLLFFLAAGAKESALAWLPVLFLWDLCRPGEGPGTARGETFKEVAGAGARGAGGADAGGGKTREGAEDPRSHEPLAAAGRARESRTRDDASPASRGLLAAAVRELNHQLARSYIYYLIPAVAYLLLRTGALAGAPGPRSIYFPVNPLAHTGLAERWLTGIKLLFYDLLLLLFPFRLSCDYSQAAIAVVRSLADPPFLLALATHGVIIALAIRSFRRHPQFLFAAGFFYATTFLTSNISLPIGTIFGERLLFTPSFALALAAGYLVGRGGRSIGFPAGRQVPAPQERTTVNRPGASADEPGAARDPEGRPARRERAPLARETGAAKLDAGALAKRLVHARGAAGVWLAAAAVMTLARNPQWHDNRTLFLHDVRVQPRSVVLRLRAAAIHLQEGDPAAAEVELEAARRILPDDPLVLNNLGDLHRLTGRPESAEALIRRSLEMAAQPPWNGHPADRYLALYNLGLLRSGQGRPAEAIPWLRKSILHRADYPPAWDALLQAGLGAASVADLRRWLAGAEAACPGDPLWLYYRGLVSLAREERAAEAERLLAEALRQRPEELRFHVALADLCAQTGRWGESAMRYREILRRFPLTGAQQAEIQNRLRLLEARGR